MTDAAPTALAVGLVAVAAGLVVTRPVRVEAVGRGAGGPPRAVLPRTLLVLAAAVALLVAGSWLSPRRFALAGIAVGVVVAVTHLLRRQRAARAAAARAEEVLALCEALAADLTAGQPPLVALDRAADEWGELAPAAAAGRMGADVPAALRHLASLPGAGQLRVLAASWQVAEETGSGLAHSVAQAASAIRVDRHTAGLVAAELASARATARMLATLPAGALLLGAGVGADPFGFLLDTPAGLVCLALGAALSFAGLYWLEGIAARVLP